MNIKIKTQIYPTEIEEKVRNALYLLFPNVAFEVDGDLLIGSTDKLEDLEKIKEAILAHAIRDTARRILKKGTFGNSVTFSINKQVATVGKVNFSDECPMGPIKVRIVGSVEEVYDYLAPSTIY